MRPGSCRASLQLRYLQTLTEIGAEQNSTVVFPMPIDLIKPSLELFDKRGKGRSLNGDARTAERGVADAPAVAVADA